MGSYIKDTRTQLVICNIRHATASSVGVSVRTVPGLKKKRYSLKAGRYQLFLSVTSKTRSNTSQYNKIISASKILSFDKTTKLS